MGDLGVYRRRRNSSYSLEIVHGDKQQAYFHWKYAELQPYFNTFRKNINKKDNSKFVLQADSICHTELTYYGLSFYDRIIDKTGLVSHKRKMPLNIKDMLTPLSLAILLMDNGNLNEDKIITISTGAYTLSESQILSKAIYEKFNIKNTARQVYNTERQKYYCIIAFGVKETKQFSDLVREFIHPTMLHKIM